ncbi:MAG TPA: hypothetical protein ENG69_05475 [Candidatus Korarchaeota archaeon]|nr:hypothetical protein [Candidatus Korarchaeota archaeon]
MTDREDLRVAAVASPIGPDVRSFVEEAVSSALKSAETAGLKTSFEGVFTEPPQEGPRGDNLLAILVITGGTESTTLHVASGWRGGLALVATPLANSLAASLEAARALRQRGVYVRVVKSVSWKDVAWREVIEASRASWAVQKLSRAKFGIIGGPSSWLVASPPELGPLRDRGASLEVVPLSELLRRVGESQLNLDEADKVIREASDSTVSKEDVVEALHLKEALLKLATERGWWGATIRCFDLLPSGVTACLALSILNRPDMVIGCEGDVPSLLSMAALSAVSGRPAWMANTTDVGPDWVLLSHCTFPLRMAESYRLTTHFESGLSVGIDAFIPEGSPVTLARLDPRSREALVIAGEALESSLGRETMCRTQIRVKIGPLAPELLRRPVGNHVAMTLGDYTEDVADVLEFLGFFVRSHHGST